MKRFLSLLTVFVLAFSLAVPASAAGNAVEGKWVFNQSYSIDTKIEEKNISFVTGDGSTWYGFLLVPNGEQIHFFTETGGSLSVATYGEWSSDKQSYMTVNFGETQIVSADFYNWLTANAVPISDDYSHTVIFRYADGSFLKSEFTSNTEFSPTGYLADNVYRVDNGKVVYQVMYESQDGLSWEQTRSNSVSNQVYNYEDGMTVYQSTFDWYDESGNRFFPVPLWEQVGMVTQGEMTGLSQTMVGTMKILTVCGVGCLALLVVLSLFGKRSLISLR